MIDPYDVDKQIEQRVKERVRMVKGRVYTGDVPDGDQIPVDAAGYVQPYIVLIFSGQIRSENRRNRGITGTRDNLKYHTFIALVVGATDDQSRRVAKQLRDALEGFEPVGGGEISEETSGSAKYPANSTLKPTRYEQMLGFSLLINT